MLKVKKNNINLYTLGNKKNALLTQSNGIWKILDKNENNTFKQLWNISKMELHGRFVVLEKRILKTNELNIHHYELDKK